MFKFSDRHIEEYHTLGYTVFRDIVPPKLIDELRIACDCGALLARERAGAQTQRFQPVSAYAIDQRPFQEFQDLPAVRDAVSRLVPADLEAPDLDVLGVLIEPAGEAWCTNWHRDWRGSPDQSIREQWQQTYQDLRMYNQINCALYEDSSTWVVPGSHKRLDTDIEAARFPEIPNGAPKLDGLSSAHRERVCLDYCQSMPHAERLYLDAGDYCFYRSCLWHLGCYIPSRKRATLHDAVMTREYREWWDYCTKPRSTQAEAAVV